MGNTFVKEKEKETVNKINKIENDSDTINWNSIKTEKLDSKNVGGALTDDSKLLLNRLELNLPANENTEVFSEVDNIFSKYQKVENPVLTNPPKSELSETSPFISSEMYNLLMKPNNTPQQTGGKINGDDSSTSSTSSSLGEKKDEEDEDDDDDETEEKPKKGKKSKRVDKKAHKNKETTVESSAQTTPESTVESTPESSEDSYESPLEGTEASEQGTTELSNSDELDYVSSSAHTEGEKPKQQKKKEKKHEKKEEQNTLSGGYETTENYESSVVVSSIQNSNNNIPYSSINTSDINMITEDSD